MFLLFRNQDTLKATKKIDIYIIYILLHRHMYFKGRYCTYTCTCVSNLLLAIHVWHAKFCTDSDLLATTENSAQ